MAKYQLNLLDEPALKSFSSLWLGMLAFHAICTFDLVVTFFGSRSDGSRALQKLGNFVEKVRRT